MNRAPAKPLGGLREIVDRYDGFVLDLWGTLHNGATPYPGVVACLEALRSAGKKCVLLSNAPRRAAAALPRIGEIGIAPHLYEALETSGEAAWHALTRRGRADADEPFLRDLGPRCYFQGPGRDRGMFEGIPVEEVPRIEDCDFILCSGLDRGEDLPTDYDSRLGEGVRRRQPMICINPDLLIHRVGTLEYCAGAIAQRYAELGGEVHQFGKPFPAVYRRTLAHFPGVDPARLLAVGDSLRTDIAGANAAGLDSLLLTEGIHVEELHDRDGGLAERLASASREYAAYPTWVAPQLVW